MHSFPHSRPNLFELGASFLFNLNIDAALLTVNYNHTTEWSVGKCGMMRVCVLPCQCTVLDLENVHDTRATGCDTTWDNQSRGGSVV